ncbi:MAG: Dabb family protein [Spirochaetaceae bacterium]|nr:MAG: Dabb family protein [Spirochaetaceae bacterium]
MTNGIRHMVVFTLRYPPDSQESRQFLADARESLSAIPTVREFEAFRQVSRKNEYQYGFSMEFAGPDEYQEYNQHPAHVAFVNERWKIEVTDFLEIDFESVGEGEL